jgi:hypothetical protein
VVAIQINIYALRVLEVMGQRLLVAYHAPIIPLKQLRAMLHARLVHRIRRQVHPQKLVEQLNAMLHQRVSPRVSHPHNLRLSLLASLLVNHLDSLRRSRRANPRVSHPHTIWTAYDAAVEPTHVSAIRTTYGSAYWPAY